MQRRQRGARGTRRRPDWTFLLGPSLILGVNALRLATALYASGLVPRIIPTLGLIGAPLLMLSAAATIFGVADTVSVIAAFADLPIAAWEGRWVSGW